MIYIMPTLTCTLCVLFHKARSVLGPLLFIVYTADLAAVALKHNVTVHAFADDTQMYLRCSRDDTSAADRLDSRKLHRRCRSVEVR